MLTLRAIFFTFLLPGTVVVWIPRMILAGERARPEPGFGRWAGIPLMAAGAAVLLGCIVDFARKGRGTLAPVDPPRKLVAVGLYRYVRNPMYLGVVTTLIGEAVFFGSRSIGIYAAVAWLVFHLWVVIYEEPHLESVFGEEYAEYRAVVPRWLPRFRPQTQASQ
jgi:protein-S-isoprenylcysteine O-methyltransferase Ste14